MTPDAHDPVAEATLQQRLAADPAASVWVNASAGTGKTKVLVDRMLRLMLAGTEPERILAVTFTKAAAANMGERVKQELAGWATKTDEILLAELGKLLGATPSQQQIVRARQLFARVLDAPGGLKIETIHAFCQSLLHRFPVEAGLPPHFDLIDDNSAAELMTTLRDRLLGRLAERPESPEGRDLDLLAATVGPEDFAEAMANLVNGRGQLIRALDQYGGVEPMLDALDRLLGAARADDPAALLLAGLTDTALDAAALRPVARAMIEAGAKADAERGADLAAVLAMAEAERPQAVEQLRGVVLTAAGTPRARLAVKATLDLAADAGEILARLQAHLLDLGERVAAVALARLNAALFRIGARFLDDYEAAKRRQGVLDYDDLIMRAAALLETPGRAAWVLFKLDGGLDHVLIDEAQDTNQEQWQLVSQLVGDFFSGQGASQVERTLFVVGDDKQSIFSFQGADPDAFQTYRRRFAARIEAAARQWRPLPMQISFRSARAVLDVVDAVLAQPEGRIGMAETPLPHRESRLGQAGRVELWPLTDPDPKPEIVPWAPPDLGEMPEGAERKLAARIVDQVDRWLKSGERLPARDRAMRAGDILILVRKRDAFFREIVRALRQADIPLAGADRMVLTEQLAVMDLLALASFLLLPEDDLTLATLLKSPLIGLDDDDLLAIGHGRRGSFWAALGAASERDQRYRQARDYLVGWLNLTDYRGPFEILSGVLARPCPADPVSGRRAIMRRLGRDAEDPIDELLNQALLFEQENAPSLQHFVHWLAAAEQIVKREQDSQAGDTVRIMTVHGAKGLQAPVVILADTQRRQPRPGRMIWPRDLGPLDEPRPPLWEPRARFRTRAVADLRDAADQKRLAEDRRLLYVALTRAEDRLVVCGLAGATASAGPARWHALVARAHEALGAVEERMPDGTTIQVHQHGQDAPPDHDRREEEQPAIPPLDPALLRLPPAEPTPARPLVPSRPASDPGPVRSPVAEGDGEARFRRGTAIHALLQWLPGLPAGDREDAGLTLLRRRYPDAAEEAVTAWVGEALAVMRDPEFAPLFGPDSLAEVPLTALVGDHALSGQIDRLVVDAGGVTVLDFKTNRPPPRDPVAVDPAYLAQMAAYRAALRSIYPGSPVRCALGWTDGPRLMWLPDGLLDGYDP
ncbi:MAG: double-strand break repair helicase AddA [Azospirillaceae bacterium]